MSENLKSGFCLLFRVLSRFDNPGQLSVSVGLRTVLPSVAKCASSQSWYEPLQPKLALQTITIGQFTSSNSWPCSGTFCEDAHVSTARLTKAVRQKRTICRRIARSLRRHRIIKGSKTRIFRFSALHDHRKPWEYRTEKTRYINKRCRKWPERYPQKTSP